MKKIRDADPVRWRDLSPSRSDIESEIGEATRLLGADAPPDELRLAQLRQRLLPRLRSDGVGVPFFARPWLRVATLVVASLGLGGVATAVTGRLIAKYRRADGRPPVVAPPEAQAPKRAARRWRVAVNAPTQLDLAVGPDGTELEVVEGRAEISAPNVPGAVRLDPGATWRDGVLGAGALPVAPVPMGSGPARVLPPSGPVVALNVPDRDARPAISSVRESGPRARREVARPAATVELPATPEIVIPPPEASPPAFDPFRVEASRTSLPNPVAAPAPLPSEAALLGRALRRLRADRDPRGALAQLDDHDRRFPTGPLGHEATLARAEALLALDQKATALAVLDALKLEGAAADRRVMLARAELRAARGRRADAIADFDALLQSAADDEISARALFGRAVLSVVAGDTLTAREDLREYLRRFASGARRFEAARMLRRLGG